MKCLIDSQVLGNDEAISEFQHSLHF